MDDAAQSISSFNFGMKLAQTLQEPVVSSSIFLRFGKIMK